jgi:hypothetical protein
MTAASPIDMVMLFQSAPPVDVVSLAKALGINVWQSDSALPAGASGLIRRDAKHGGQSSYSIIVRASDPPVRKRFTIAHEIAHFILHKDRIGNQLSDDAMYRSGLGTSEEHAANRLAADILMPMKLIQGYQQIHPTHNSRMIATAFGVSDEAMRIRLGLA